MQHSLEARKVVANKISSSDEYCFDPQRYFLLGGSFGSFASFSLQTIYQDLFHGAIGTGASGVTVQSLYGHWELMRWGLQPVAQLNLPGAGQVGHDWIADYYYANQVLKILQMNKQNPGDTGSLCNLALLERLENRDPNDPLKPIITRPIFVVGGDEEPVVQFQYFRHLLDALAALPIAGIQGLVYGDFLKVISLPFRAHGNVTAGESMAFYLKPADHLSDDVAGDVPSGGDIIDWLIDRSIASDALPQWTTTVDEGVPAPNEMDEYLGYQATIASPPDSASGNLNIVPLWDSPSGDSSKPGFRGTGHAPGQFDNMYVADIGGDADLEVVYGDASGFVHIYEWEETSPSNGQLISKWRSPDMGGAITSISIGDFNDSAGGGSAKKRVIAISKSGELWMIDANTTPPTAVEVQVNTGVCNSPSTHLMFGGERENPLVAVGPYDGGTRTDVYVLGTSPVYKNQSCAEQDADPTPNYSFLTTLNYGLGYYLRMSPRGARRIKIKDEHFYIVVGQPGSDRGDPANPPNLSLVVLDTAGLVRGKAEVRNAQGRPIPVNALDVLNVDNQSQTARIAVGCSDGLRFFDVHKDSVPLGGDDFSFDPVFTTSGPEVFWTTHQAYPNGDDTQPAIFKNTGVLSLECFDNAYGTRLVGTTAKGAVFVWDIDDQPYHTLSDYPVILHQEEPFFQVFGGMKVIDKSFNQIDPNHPVPFGCPDDLELSLNVLPYYSYDHERAPSNVGGSSDEFASGSIFYKLDPETGATVCKRDRSNLAMAFNPDRRTPDLIANDQDDLIWDVLWTDAFSVDLDEHVFRETVAVGNLSSDTNIFDVAYTPRRLNGKLSFETDYLNNLTPTNLPTGSIFMIDDRYYAAFQTFGTGVFSPAYTGNAVAIGDITSETGEEIVFTTIGGRVVLASESGEIAKSWDSASTPSEATGDFGYLYTGLALYDVDNDGFDEIFAVGSSYIAPGAGANEINSHLLIWDSDGSTPDLASPDLAIDLGEPGCLGLWVGPAIATCPGANKLDVIVGKSQTFAIYAIETGPISIDASTPRYESMGLGSNIGAFNSIRVAAAQDAPSSGFLDYIFVGSTAYVYGFKSPNYTICGLGH